MDNDILLALGNPLIYHRGYLFYKAVVKLHVKKLCCETYVQVLHNIFEHVD